MSSGDNKFQSLTWFSCQKISVAHCFILWDSQTRQPKIVNYVVKATCDMKEFNPSFFGCFLLLFCCVWLVVFFRGESILVLQLLHSICDLRVHVWNHCFQFFQMIGSLWFSFMIVQIICNDMGHLVSSKHHWAR